MRTHESNISRGTIPISATNSGTETVSYIPLARRRVNSSDGAHARWKTPPRSGSRILKPSLRRNLSSSTKRILLQETYSRTTTTNRYLSPIRRSRPENKRGFYRFLIIVHRPLSRDCEAYLRVKRFKSQSATRQYLCIPLADTLWTYGSTRRQNYLECVSVFSAHPFNTYNYNYFI